MANYHYIGDVHGMSAALDALMNKLAPASDDVVVFLGDLLDKGPDPLGVVQAVRQMAESAPFEVVLIEGNHEDLHRRYRRNLTERPKIAEEQAARHAELAALTASLDENDVAFLDAAVPFYSVKHLGILAVHGGIPGDIERFPESVAEVAAMSGRKKQAFGKILRTRFIDQQSGAFIALNEEKDGDPFWAKTYDGRFGHIVFGHTPFMDGAARFPFATGIDTGAAYGGALSALSIAPDGSRTVSAVDA